MSKKVTIHYCDEEEMLSVMVNDPDSDKPAKNVFYGNDWDLPNDAHSLKNLLNDIGEVLGFSVEINEVQELISC